MGAPCAVPGRARESRARAYRGTVHAYTRRRVDASDLRTPVGHPAHRWAGFSRPATVTATSRNSGRNCSGRSKSRPKRARSRPSCLLIEKVTARRRAGSSGGTSAAAAR